MTRYAQIIAGSMAPRERFTSTVENEEQLQVERGIVLADVVIDPTRIEGFAAVVPPGDGWGVVDRLGQARPVYAGVLVYAWASAFSISGHLLMDEERERCSAALSDWGRQLQEFVPMLWSRLDEHLPLAAWAGTALMALGSALEQEPWRESGKKIVASIAQRQTREGSFVRLISTHNLESYWYDELVILHAMTNCTVHWPGSVNEDVVARAAEYHFNEIQPDHATCEPWGLMAFINHAPSRMLADQILHGVSMQYPAGVTGVGSILLADVLHGLRVNQKI